MISVTERGFVGPKDFTLELTLPVVLLENY